MGTYIFKILFAMLVWFSHTQLSSLGFISSSPVKCIERERQALLNFKQGLVDVSGMLSTWRDDEKNRDCCKWKGIQCNNQTGHVHVLHLRGRSHLQGFEFRCHDTQHLTGAVNLSSLIALQNIEHLELSSNDFPGSHIPELMGSFTNLRYLNLSDSGFGGSIPYELGNLSKLEYLDLKRNSLDGAIPFQLGKLTSLQYLDLSDSFFRGEIPYQLGNLSHLRYLDLGYNSLSGIIPFQVGNLPMLHTLRLGGNFDLKINDAKWLSSLSALTTLGLDNINLGSSHHWLQMINGLIPNLRELSLVHCSLSDDNISSLFPSHSNHSISLSMLDLSQNQLKSSAVFHWLFKCTTNLRSLNLGMNLLEGPIPDEFGKVMNSLEVLYLGSNKLQGEIPASLGNICTLQALDLSNNNLRGEISSFIQNASWCNRHVFQTLVLSSNWITGMIPNLSIFTSLRILDLSNNQLTGEIPKSLGLLHELQSLYLEENHLEGNITVSHLTNLSKLKELDLTDNSLSLEFGTTWVPSFQLLRLGLASCKLGPRFPSWLQTQSCLSFLDISNAVIDDFVPDWFWNKLQFIRRLNMSYNSLRGTIPNLPIELADEDTYIILSSNQLEGEIPAFLSQAYALDLSKNKISDLNTFLCRKSATTNIGTLDLSNNQILGQLPNCWEHLQSSLEFLDLSNNKLSGKIPQSMGTLVNLQALVLRHNSLTGDLPIRLKNCTGLVVLDVSENLLSGPIPSWIGESLQQLKILSLRVNHFFGIVPVHLCYLRQIHLLDLSRNHLSGGIPSCLKNFTAMMERSVITSQIVRKRKMTTTVTYSDIYDTNVLLMWKGQESVFLNPEIFLKSIDLSGNDLAGEIPKEVWYLVELVSLNLARNNLHGEIPSEIGSLSSLDFLDLSRNHFSGKIPSTLSKIDGLGMLDLSNNDLSGKIPWEGHLQTFDASSFEGNIDLCGEPLNTSCPGDEATLEPQGPAVEGEDDDNSVFYGALYMSLGLGFFTGFWGLLGPILLWQPWRIAYLRFLNRVTDYILVMVQLSLAKCRRWLKG